MTRINCKLRNSETHEILDSETINEFFQKKTKSLGILTNPDGKKFSQYYFQGAIISVGEKGMVSINANDRYLANIRKIQVY